MKKFVVEYWEHVAVFKSIEAENEEEAEEKMREMVECGEVDMAKEGEVGDCGYDVIGEEENGQN